MQSDTVLSEEDEGKTVTSSSGTIGKVLSVKHGTAYVDPDPSLTDDIRATLGWAEPDEDTYPIDGERIETITDDEIHLNH